MFLILFYTHLENFQPLEKVNDLNSWTTLTAKKSSILRQAFLTAAA